MSQISYHLSELKIARDKSDARRVMPKLLPSDRTLLDIGCGIGQSFVALECTDKICVGLDIDEKVLRYGIEHYGDRVQFILSDAAVIPMPADTFDLVYSRVSLPYTNIPKVFKEIKRVIKPGGRIWVVMHSKDMVLKQLRVGIREHNIKSIAHGIYALVNGYCLKYFGKVFPFINGHYESWQDASTTQRLLRKVGFNTKVENTGKHTVIEGIYQSAL